MSASGEGPEKTARRRAAPWKVRASRYSFRDRWLSVRSDSCTAADGTAIDPYHIVELPDWVNVVALTQKRDIVLVNEYRHGTGEIALELPSGTIEPGEAALAAAQRELLEETGFGGGHWYQTGCNAANPARQNNRIVSFLALDVESISTPKTEPGELIDVLRMPLGALLYGLSLGKAQLHSQHLASLFNALLPMLSTAGGMDAAMELWRRLKKAGKPQDKA
jgi:8-oxo-dGTP pyrophosphatase MutT (NUDIX family)